MGVRQCGSEDSNDDAEVLKAIGKAKETGKMITNTTIYFRINEFVFLEQQLIQELGYNPFQVHLNSNSSAVRNQITNVKVGSIDVGAVEAFTMPGITGGSTKEIPQSPVSHKESTKVAADREVGLMNWLSQDELAAFVDADCRAVIESAVAHVLHTQVKFYLNDFILLVFVLNASLQLLRTIL